MTLLYHMNPTYPTPPQGEPTFTTPQTTTNSLDNFSWWKFTSTDTNNTPPQTKTFGEFKDTDQKQWSKLFHIHTITAIVWGTICTVLGLSFWYITQINLSAIANEDNRDSGVETYKETILALDEIFGYPWITEHKHISELTNANQVTTILNSSIPFLFKKDIMTDLVDKLKTTILAHHKEAHTLSQDITKYGFIHPDVMSLMENSKDKIPITTSLHTLETVKFGTAIKLFSMIDSFIAQASQVLWLAKNVVESTIATYLDNGELYISNYLSMCYLNPYERLPDCNQINDFHHYFLYEQPDNKINQKDFSKLLSLVEEKLEKSTIASVKIDFEEFNPNEKNLNFKVTINTLAEDEKAFLQKNILNPHVFILSTLVNLLKQSLFVIGDGINIQNITVEEQIVPVGNIQIPIKTSSMSFNLPLQNLSQREIFDYLDFTKY